MQFIDLKAQYAALKGEIDANMQDVLNDAAFIGGKYVKELETQLAAFTGRKHCITCANGTDALQLAFMALGVGEGDAVFAPDMTFISSTEPAAMFGAVSPFSATSPLTPTTLTPQALSVRSRQCWQRGNTHLKQSWRWTFSATPATMTPSPRFAKNTALPHRGRGAKLRRGISREKGLLLRTHRYYLLLPGKAPGLLRRRRRGVHG